MEYLLLALFAVTILVLVRLAAVKKSKKPASEQSGGDKLIYALKSKLNKTFSDLADGIRTPEVIETEIIEALADFYEQKCQEFKNTLTSYTNVISSTETSIKQLENSITNITAQLDDFKTKYKEAYEPRRNELMPIIKSALATRKNLEDMSATTRERLFHLKCDKESVQSKIDIFVASYNIKKIDILSKVAMLKTATLDSSISTAIDVDRLVSDLEVVVTKKIDDNIVDKKFYGTQTETAVSIFDPAIDKEARKFLEE